MPQLTGSIRPRAAFAAIAASTAEPPVFRISRPICVASGWLVHTMPRWAMTSDRVANDLPVTRSIWADPQSGKLPAKPTAATSKQRKGNMASHCISPKNESTRKTSGVNRSVHIAEVINLSAAPRRGRTRTGSCRPGVVAAARHVAARACAP